MIGIGIGLTFVNSVLDGGSLEVLLLADGSISVDAGTGTLALTVAETGIYDGTYSLSPDVLETGPANLVPPNIPQTGGVGDTLTHVAGLWVYDGDNPAPTIATQWRRDGISIPGANSATYVLQTVDAGTQIDVLETATDNNGTRSAASAAVSIAATASEIALVDSASNSGGTSAPSYTFSSRALGDVDPDRTLFVLACGFHGASGANYSATIGGQAMTLIASEKSLDNFGFLALFKADTDPGGTTGDVTLTMGVSDILSLRCAIHIVRVISTGGVTVTDIESTATADEENSVPLDVVAGGFALAGANRSGDNTQPTITGLTQRGAPWVDWDDGEFLSLAFDPIDTTETQRAIVTDANDAGVVRHMSIAVAFG